MYTRNTKVMNNEDLQKLFAESQKIVDATNSIIKNVSDVDIYTSIKQYIPTALEKVNFRMIRMLGYTPYFNDGDPCIHRFYLCFGDRKLNSRQLMRFDDIDEHFDAFEEYLSEDGFELDIDKIENFDVLPLISEDDAKTINQLCNNINVLLETAGQTNFLFKIYKTRNGEIKVDVDDYDPS